MIPFAAVGDARREPAAAEPDRLAPARDRGDRVLRRRRRLLRRPGLPHRSPRPSALAARRLPDPGLGVDARAPASADPLLPRRQDLATVALDARGRTSRSWPCSSCQLTITDLRRLHRARRSGSTPPASSSSSAASSGGGAGFAVVVLVFLGISLSWVIRQVVLYRRSRGDRRQQLKWLLAGGSFAVFGFFVAITIGTSSNGALLGDREGGLPRADRAADLDRDRDPPLPAVRDRPADLADALLRAR